MDALLCTRAFIPIFLTLTLFAMNDDPAFQRPKLTAEELSPWLKHAKTRKQVAGEFKIDIRSLAVWLERQSIRLPQGALCPKTQILIYETLGLPVV